MEDSKNKNGQRPPPIPDLHCREDRAQLEEGNPSMDPQVGFESEEAEEYIEAMVSKEGSFERTVNGNGVPIPRRDTVRWILKMKDNMVFKMSTAYLAVTYFDRFFARKVMSEEKGWAVKLLSVACLFLAAKMEESSVPVAPKFWLEGYRIDNATMERMELLVLDTLEWRMSLVTPFDCLGYFATKFQLQGKEDFIPAANRLILQFIQDMDLVDYRPSAIAAAAILAASGLTKTAVESKLSSVSLPETLQTEHVLACYNLMAPDSQEELKQAKASASSSSTKSNKKARTS